MQINWIPEAEALILLQRSKKTVRDWIREKKITPDMYRRMINGAIVFDKNKLFRKNKPQQHESSN